MNDTTSTGTKKTEQATLAGGCFWCLEAVFEQIEGVASVESGYTGGSVAHPTYKQVCSGTTGHAEVIQLTYDPDRLSYREVLEIFFAFHDPTTLNRQGATSARSTAPRSSPTTTGRRWRRRRWCAR